ncbi:SA0570 family protein [Staphylococcus americanisciuri]|uniref:Lipoprotein n=1 Tax=Staphylococcus americanisciuri TaxID=2973940 RepID=A0ABT2F2B8_9STAP|nr:hypothetical protein [Staphylococcus americanisciuri]MCS4486512.1 hypothetical protein [Staphylococcus americanisciuri]
MKKYLCVLMVLGMMIACLGVTPAQAATGNTIQSVKALQTGDQVLESVKIGQRMKDVIRTKGKGIHTMSAYSDEQYYEYRTDEGLLRITANNNKATAKVIRVSMSYNEVTGPTYQEVQKQVHDTAIQRAHYNNVTGNTGYIADGKVSYQFTTTHPKDKQLKLYRIDLEA